MSNQPTPEQIIAAGVFILLVCAGIALVVWRMSKLPPRQIIHQPRDDSYELIREAMRPPRYLYYRGPKSDFTDETRARFDEAAKDPNNSVSITFTDEPTTGA